MTKAEPSKRKRLNTEQRRALKAAKLKSFVQEYGRRAQKGVEPNDRRYDREVEQIVKRMRPDELDRLLRDDAE
jgi:ribosomal protein S20